MKKIKTALGAQISTCQNIQKHNKNMHSDKIKLRSFLTTLYFAGDVKR